jgi:hypothetical protein
MADILIAEQMPDIQDVLLRILGRAGHAIRLTGDTYLGEPLTPADLIGHVDALLAGSGAIIR